MANPSHCDRLLLFTMSLRERVAKELEKSMGQPPAPAAQSAAPASQLSDVDRHFLNRVTDYIYLAINGKKNVDVNDVAARICMSYGQFNRKLSALTGYTPAQYIQRMKIKMAQRLLMTHPEMGFNEVAERCGFSDYSNFVRAFRNVSGVTPTQFVRRG